jgi:hypothetical protein
MRLGVVCLEVCEHLAENVLTSSCFAPIEVAWRIEGRHRIVCRALKRFVVLK